MRVELHRIMNYAAEQNAVGKQLALVTIVKTVGSSYRKKGVQMIVNEDLHYVGAISGGCVENAVLREAQVVFERKQSVVFTYDGQYKLGCNGTIYILIEYLEPDSLEQLLLAFEESQQHRMPIYLHLDRASNGQAASTTYEINGRLIRNSDHQAGIAYDDTERLEIPPQQQLIIVGGEHDSVSLAKLAHQVGFQVTLMVKESFRNELPMSIDFFFAQPEALDKRVTFDEYTAIVLMTHSLSKDLHFLQQLVTKPSFYLGALGPESRRNTLINSLLELDDSTFIEHGAKIDEMHGPVGLEIGAQTPEEISISILSEIIGCYHKKMKMEKKFMPESV